MAIEHSVIEWLQLIGLGGLLGVLGQGIRMIVGFKKLHDESAEKGVTISDLVRIDRIIVPLLIGFIAGALASIPTLEKPAEISAEQLLTLLAAGYAGADFIEGFMSRMKLPKAEVEARAGGLAGVNA